MVVDRNHFSVNFFLPLNYNITRLIEFYTFSGNFMQNDLLPGDKKRN
jgi:hypothetical protein